MSDSGVVGGIRLGRLLWEPPNTQGESFGMSRHLLTIDLRKVDDRRPVRDEEVPLADQMTKL